MTIELNLLVIEDNESDFALLERHLRRAGFQLSAKRVETLAKLREALADRNLNCVISDYQVPGMDALAALALVRQVRDGLPFIVVSGLIGEERAVELMRAGAKDYVMKDHLARLAPVIERELVEAARYVEQRRLEAELRLQEQRFQLALRATGDGVWDWNPQTGETNLSAEFLRILGYAEGELPNDMQQWRMRIHPDDQAQVDAANDAHVRGELPMYRSEHRVRCKDGRWKWVLDRGVIIRRDHAGKPLREVGTLTDISETKRLQDAYRQSHDVLQKLSRRVPGMLYQLRRSADGKMELPFISDNARTIYELSDEEVAGDIQAALAARRHPDDTERVLQSIDRSARDLTPWIMEYRIVLPSGGTRWVYGESQPERLDDGSVLWHGFVRDVTEAKAAESELRLLQACIQQINDAVLVTAAEPVSAPGPTIVYANAAVTAQTGYAISELIGASPRILQGSGTDRAELSRIGDALRQWRPIRTELLNYSKSGEPFWAEINIAPVTDANGWHTHWVSVQRDITARKHAEAERERLIRELEVRNAELDAYNHSIAHDLRNPLITIRGMADVAELALQQGDTNRARQYLARVGHAANQADALIRNLMQLATLGKRALQPARLHLGGEINAILREMELLIEPSDAVIELDLAAEANTIHADGVLLQVILRNLIGNAIKHRHAERSPRLRISAGATASPAGIEIRVEDNGIGIEASAHDRVFRLFERISSATSGTGVGLALTERAARMHDGRAYLVRSQVGVGSCFAVWLPAADRPARATEAALDRQGS